MRIRKLSDGDSDIINGMKRTTVSSMRIRAEFKAYGTGYDFVSFFADDGGNIVICAHDNLTVLYLADNNNQEYIKLAADFLSAISDEILAEAALPITHLNEEIGNTYYWNNPQANLLLNVSDRIDDAYSILSQVFPSSINEQEYNRWYTDLSYRIRHGMSRIYSYDGCCSGTAFCCENNAVMIAQLGTLEHQRGKGYALKMIQHIVADCGEISEISTVALLSQDRSSDSFYEKIGFELYEHWYYYTRRSS